MGWAIRLCKRIEVLHRHGVAHGGISADLVLTETHDCTSAGKLGDVRHTPAQVAYHSPERVSGRGISQADDTWAVAVTLYVMLTGTLPFSGGSTQPTQRFGMAPAPLAVFDVGDDALQAILDRFLAVAPRERSAEMAALRDALSRWKHGTSLAHLPPLEDGVDDSYGDYDEDDDDEDDDEDYVQTVMRDFSDVREHLKRIDASKAPAPSAGRPRPAAGAPHAGAPQPAPPAGLPHRPQSVGRQPSPGVYSSVAVGDARSAPLSEPRGAPRPVGAPGMSVARPSPHSYPGGVPSGPLGPSAVPARATAEADAPLGSAPGFDVDDEDSDEDVRTMLMEADQANLSAAIEEALAAKARAAAAAVPAPVAPAAPAAPARPPQPAPGWPTPRRGEAEDDESLAPTAAFDASMLPAGAMPDPTGRSPLMNTVDRVLNEIPLPPPRPPESEPELPLSFPADTSNEDVRRPEPFGASVGFPTGGSGGEGPGIGAPLGPEPRTFAATPAPGTGAGTSGVHGMPGVTAGDLPQVADAPSTGLRTALIVAVVVLVMVVVAVSLLFLQRQGTIDLGIPLGPHPSQPAPTPSP